MNAQKAFAKSLAAHDWILNIDADERVTQELAREIQDILGRGEIAMVTSYPEKFTIWGRWIEHSGWYPDYKLRFFKANKGRMGWD